MEKAKDHTEQTDSFLYAINAVSLPKVQIAP